MRKFMIAYNSPKYGVLMTEVETAYDLPTPHEIEYRLVDNEGETAEDAHAIVSREEDYCVRELKQKPLDKYKLDKIIFEWVKRMFGESEALDPSWSIVELANEIANEYGE